MNDDQPRWNHQFHYDTAMRHLANADPNPAIAHFLAAIYRLIYQGDGYEHR